MKIDKIYLLIATILFMLHACGGGDKDTFIVETDFKNANNVPFILVQENENGLVKDTLMAENGFLLFASKADSLTKLNFYIWGYSQPLPIYVKNTERYQLKGDLTNPYAVEVSGSTLNQQLSTFRAANATLLKTLAYVDTVISRPHRDSLQNIFNDAVIKQVARHPSQTASAVLLADYLCKHNQHQLVDSLYQLLSPKAIPSFVADKVEAFLSLTQKNAVNTPIYNFTATTNNKETINTSFYAKKPTIYLFWSMRDSLTNLNSCRDISILYKNFKHLDVEWVNVSLDSDTALWRKKLQERKIDSLGVQIYLPMGFSSDVADSLGILSAPFFILQDTTGHIVSKGADGAAFLTSFEKLMIPYILSDSLLIDSAMTNAQYRRNTISRAAGGFYN